MSTANGSTKACILVLASQSKNRKELLNQMGIEPIVKISDFEENLSKSLSPTEFVIGTAEGKLKVVEKSMKDNKEYYDAIIAADTVIFFEGEIIGKPRNKDDAINTLKRLRLKEHQVFSGVAIAYRDGTIDRFAEKTTVKFANFSDETIEKYVSTGEPLNKAGSYGIGNLGAILVEKIDGCFGNIVGLPIGKLFSKLTAKGIDIFQK